MLEVPLDPVIFRIGSVQMTWYWLVYLVGFLVGFFMLKGAVKRKEIKISNWEVYYFTFWIILGLMIGARLFHVVFWGWSYYLQNPILMLYIWKGGLSFHGGLIGSLVVIGIFCWRKNLSFYKFVDLFAVLGIIMPAFSRIANFINHEIVGIVTNVRWCFRFNYWDGCRHPVQLYASAGRFLFFFFFISWRRKLKKYKEGFWFWLAVFGVGLGRFFLDFLREDLIYYGLKAGQWMSLIMVLIGGFMLWKNYKPDLRKIFLF